MMAIFIAPMVSVVAGAYVNAMMPYLLQDEEYFAIPFDNVGSEAGQVLFWAYLISTLITPTIGYIYDMLGRFWFIIPSCFILCLFVAIIPFSAPHFWLLCVFRSVMSCLINAIHVNPLIIDYIKSKSRGLMMSFATLGLVLGELLMVLLFSVTRKLTMMQQYYIPAICITLVSVSLIWLVREPDRPDLKELKAA